MSALLWLLIALPLGAGAVLGMAGRAAGRAAPAVAVAVAAAVLGLAVAVAVGRPAARAPLFAGMPARMAVDGLSAVLVVTVAAVTLCVLVFAAGECGAGENRGRFFGLMLLFAGAMLVTVTARTLPLLLMAWEAMGATSWALIGHWWRGPRRVRAADTAFLTTRAADLGLYLAAGAALAGGVGSLELDALPRAASPWLEVTVAGVVAAALGKSAQLPFSFWLSRAMEGPSPVSALLHSATMVAAGAYLLLRAHPLLAAVGWAGPLVAWLGAGTALALGLVAVAQRDLKQLLAASTAAQVGFMVLAAGSGGTAAGTAQLVAHAATKSGLFLAAGVWLNTLGTRQLPELTGAARARPLVGAAFAVGALTLAGLPPLSLWAAKDTVLAAARTESTGLYVLGLAAAAVAAVYSVKAIRYVTGAPPQPGPPPGRGPGAGARRGGGGRDGAPEGGGPGVVVPLWVLTGAAAVAGVLSLPGPAAWLRGLTGDAAGRPPSVPEWAVSTGVVCAAAGYAWWRAPRPGRARPAPARWAADWLGLERAAHLLLVRPVFGLARALAAFDDRVVDGAVRQTGRCGLAVARLARRLDDGGIDAAVRALAAGARRLGHWARRPQTGLLHQYYAQAAVGFAVLVLIALWVR
ncbi:NADH-quinone oxidoreductase subunit L [Streptomyces sp. NRRL F-5053]|uniref:NADH-quinone oxidoreductase subunit 5 family protein n=1 Tax=Streptomyces sp. NRRL F-5053 TaxID=1463854 RepID=UPI0004C8876F|nr:proton-conducting transporter membrane subunit [Streptomyces sp. NRRL F-5053]